MKAFQDRRRRQSARQSLLSALSLTRLTVRVSDCDRPFSTAVKSSHASQQTEFGPASVPRTEGHGDSCTVSVTDFSVIGESGLPSEKASSLCEDTCEDSRDGKHEADRQGSSFSLCFSSCRCPAKCRGFRYGMYAGSKRGLMKAEGLPEPHRSASQETSKTFGTTHDRIAS